MAESPADDSELGPATPSVRAGWRIAIGVAAIVASAFTFVLLPVVATVVAGWWLAADVRSTGGRAPGWLGKVALAMLALLWFAISWLVVGFDAHTDCGGTLGGYGESASARLDEECYDRRIVRVPVAMVGVAVGSVGAGVWLRRWARREGDDRSGRPRSPEAAAAMAVGACTVAWSALAAVLVVT